MKDSLIKVNIHTQCINHVLKTLEVYKKGISDAQDGLQSESKSSAGDKHETGRAMLQLETEKLGSQYQETLKSLHFLQQMELEKNEKIKLGSLIKTSLGLFYIAFGIGKLTLDNNTSVFVLSIMAPLAQAMLGKKEGDSFLFNSKTIQIITLE